MKRVLAALDTLAARIALLLTVGTIVAVSASLLVAERARRADLIHLQGERVLASTVDVVTRLERDPSRTLEALDDGGIIGAHRINGPAPGGVDTPLTDLLRQRLRTTTPVRLRHADARVCAADDPFWRRQRAAGFGRPILPECWILTTLVLGKPVIVGLGFPIFPTLPSAVGSPVFLVSVLVGCVGLSLAAAQLASRPVRRLTNASRSLARSIDADPVPEGGPRDVREALATFNLMQRRVQDGVRERTRLLAAISHDLQTPLTRLRLRLEQVDEEALRDRLIADLSATLRMVRRGLELARSGESHEEWTVVDVDSLLASLADDAAGVGQDVRFETGCHILIRTKPDALIRCLQNLIDNAVKYGGAAVIGCERGDGSVIIVVRDHGPGMREDFLARAFEPFVRGDTDARDGEGSGIGLAIAKAQARAIAAALSLQNHVDGGMEARIKFQL